MSLTIVLDMFTCVVIRGYNKRKRENNNAGGEDLHAK